MRLFPRPPSSRHTDVQLASAASYGSAALAQPAPACGAPAESGLFHQSSLPLVVILGTGRRARQVAEQVEQRGLERVHAFLDDHPQTELEIDSARYRGGLGEFWSLVAEAPVERVIYALPRRFLASESIERLVETCGFLGMDVVFPMDLFSARAGHVSSDQLGSVPAFRFAAHRRPRWKEGVKRAIDVIGAGALLLATLPVWLLAALAVKIDSRGPVLFKQTRSGRFGRPFTFLKLRTMVEDAEQIRSELESQNEQSGPVFKIANDPRVTRVGRWLRRYSIDELPQLLNVLVGQMSLVGPRPPLPKEVLEYELEHRARLSVRPGLTCLWQISGRSDIPFRDWVKLDLQYIESWSLTLDLRIMLRTIPAVLTARGAH